MAERWRGHPLQMVLRHAPCTLIGGQCPGGAHQRQLAAQAIGLEVDAERGGALEGQDGACIRLADYQAQFDPDFVAGALDVAPDGPSDPVKTQFGWHVIVARPYDEVADSLAALLLQAPGEMLLGGWLVTQRVDVASRYGRWNPAQGAVVPL